MPGLVAERKPGLLPTFDLSEAVVDAELRVGRQSRVRLISGGHR